VEVAQRVLKQAWALAVETLCGAAAFLVIAAMAVMISYVVAALEKQPVDLFIIYGLRFGEYLLFGADILMFVRFIYRATLRAWQNM
jgi:hypothetical protein